MAQKRSKKKPARRPRMRAMNVRITEDMYRKLNDLAEAEERMLSEEVREMIKGHLRRNAKKLQN